MYSDATWSYLLQIHYAQGKKTLPLDSLESATHPILVFFFILSMLIMQLSSLTPFLHASTPIIHVHTHLHPPLHQPPHSVSTLHIHTHTLHTHTHPSHSHTSHTPFTHHTHPSRYTHTPFTHKHTHTLCALQTLCVLCTHTLHTYTPLAHTPFTHAHTLLLRLTSSHIPRPLGQNPSYMSHVQA